MNPPPLLVAPPDCLNLQGVDYFVPWGELPVFASVFLPTLIDGRELRGALKLVQRRYNIRLVQRPRVEYGRLGYRVWRVA